MSTTIQIKRSSTASAVPLSGDLAVGELAVNLADKRLFAKQADGTIIELSTNPTDLDAATLRIDGVEITASATELNSLDGLTATTAELNILDGVTATATEINVLDGITSTTTELNKLDGFTGSTAELNLLDGVTATTAELNVLDGITASTTELNYTDGVTSSIQTQLSNKQPLDPQLTDISILIPTDGSFIVGDGTNFVTESGATAIASLGVTATAAELNTLDGITATTTELNYTDGVTSNIQTQLNGKATTAQGALADSAVQPNDNVSFGTGSFTGAVTADGFQLGAGDKLYFNADRYFTPENNVDGAEVSANGNFTVKTGGTPSKSLVVGATGDVHFFEDTGTTAKMVWSSSSESLDFGSTGSITYSAGNFRIDSGDIGLHFNSGSDVIYPSNGSGGLNDASVDLGLSSSRFKNLHLSGEAKSPKFISDSTTGGQYIIRKGGSASAFIGEQSSGLGSGDGLLIYTYNSGTIKFYPEAGSVATMDSDGLKMETGKGIYLGGTGAANKLDDYEEGTWTPTIIFGGSDTGVSYATRAAKYTKVGRLVTYYIEVGLSSRGTSTGNLGFLGFPFTPTNLASPPSILTGSLSSTSDVQGYLAPSGLFLENRNTGMQSPLTHDNVNNNSTFYICGVYETA